MGHSHNMQGCQTSEILQIPAKIFYVWDGPLPEKVSDCIGSWRKVMPDYEVVEVNNSSSYFDFQGELERCAWFKTVYERKMWAYVSDYIRVKTLLDHGGIYCDTDITALKSFDRFRKHELFTAFESPTLINMSIFGCIPGHPLLYDLYAFYQKDIWETPVYTIPEITTRLLTQKYACILYDSRKFQKIVKFGAVTLYPEKFFYPYRYDETYDDSCVSEDTHTIHWWNASWTKQETINWLKTKHLPATDGRSKKHDLQTVLRHTESELRLEVMLFNKLCLFRAYKQADCKIIKLFGRLPLLTLMWKNDCIMFFLFNYFHIYSRVHK